MLSNKARQHFEGKTIWVTGASSGIGRALVLLLSEIDCNIFISSRSKEKLNVTIDQCANKNVIALEGDLTSKNVNKEIVKQIIEKTGSLDIAILNAGTCEYVDVKRFDSELFRRLIESNFMSMVYGIEATLPPLMKSSNAQLIGMSSTAAYLGLPRSEAYGATKAAIRNMFSALRVSLEPLHICASVICPGFVETELTDQNDFEMPALIKADLAAEYILRGIVNRKQEIHFPKRFSVTLKLLASLPNPILSKLIRKTMVNS